MPTIDNKIDKKNPHLFLLNDKLEHSCLRLGELFDERHEKMSWGIWKVDSKGNFPSSIRMISDEQVNDLNKDTWFAGKIAGDAQRIHKSWAREAIIQAVSDEKLSKDERKYYLQEAEIYERGARSMGKLKWEFRRKAIANDVKKRVCSACECVGRAIRWAAAKIVSIVGRGLQGLTVVGATVVAGAAGAAVVGVAGAGICAAGGAAAGAPFAGVGAGPGAIGGAAAGAALGGAVGLVTGGAIGLNKGWKAGAAVNKQFVRWSDKISGEKNAEKLGDPKTLMDAFRAWKDKRSEINSGSNEELEVEAADDSGRGSRESSAAGLLYDGRVGSPYNFPPPPSRQPPSNASTPSVSRGDLVENETAAMGPRRLFSETPL